MKFNLCFTEEIANWNSCGRNYKTALAAIDCIRTFTFTADETDDLQTLFNKTADKLETQEPDFKWTRGEIRRIDNAFRE